MKFNNVYFFNGSAYAGKSTMVKRLAEKYDGVRTLISSNLYFITY